MEKLKENAMFLLRTLLRTIWVVLNNFYCIPVYILIICLISPIYLVRPNLFYKLEETMFTWLLSMVSCWNWSAGYYMAESGDSLDDSLRSKILFMPNHQSTADVPLLMTIFTSRMGLAGRIMWLMDKVFKYTNFGICSWIHDDFFIQAGKNTREESLRALRTHLNRVFSNKTRDCLVLFPEGGFLRKRKAVSQSFSKKNDLPILEHCTIPRTGALDVIMQVLGPNGSAPEKNHITKIVDVTIAYPEGKPLDLITIITGWRFPCITHIHYRMFDVSELHLESKALFAWMVNLYKEKEEMLAEYYRTGEFPYTMFNPSAQPPRVIEHKPSRYVVGHAAFIAATLGAALYLTRIYSYA